MLSAPRPQQAEVCFGSLNPPTDGSVGEGLSGRWLGRCDVCHQFLELNGNTIPSHPRLLLRPPDAV